MHEYALAEAVMRATLRTAATEGFERVTAVHVRVGELQQIKQDLFAFALDQVRPDDDPRLAATDFRVEVVAARLACRVCAHGFSFAEAQGSSSDDDLEAVHFVPELAHAFFACPACGSPDFDVAEGRGVTIQTIEGEQAAE